MAAMVHTIVIVVLIRPGWGRCIFEIKMQTFSRESAGKVMRETAVKHRRVAYSRYNLQHHHLVPGSKTSQELQMLSPSLFIQGSQSNC